MARLSSVLLAVTLLLGCVSCLNLVKDPSFERDCPPVDFATAELWGNSLGTIVSQQFYQLPAHSGRCVSDFFDDDAANPAVVDVTQSIPMSPGATYRVTARVRAIDLGGASVNFAIGTFTADISVAAGQGWVPFTAEFTATSGGNQAFTYSVTSGSPLIDDIEIRCIGAFCPSIQGDPHVTGFHGEKIEITGKSQTVFNVISDSDVQVNGRLGSVHLNNLVLGNYIKEMGLMIRNHTVLVLAGGDSIPETAVVMLDGQKINAPFKATIDDIITIEYVKVSGNGFDFGLQSSDNVGSIVRISYNYEYDFEIFNIENGFSNGAWVSNPRRFINFQSSIHHDRDPEGIFGRTFHPENKRADFAVTDYHLASSDIFGKDFEFNRFKSF